MRRILRASLALLTAVIAGCSGCGCGTIARIPTPLPTITAAPMTTPSAVPTAAPTATPLSASPVPSLIPTPVISAVPSATPLPTAVPTAAPTPMPTASPTPTPIIIIPILPTNTPTPTPVPTPKPSPPEITKSFAAGAFPINGEDTLIIDFTNPNATTLTNVRVIDPLPQVSPSPPGQMSVASNPAASISAGCGSSVAFAPAGGDTTLSIAGVTLAGGGVCEIRVNITANAIGTYNNVTDDVDSNESGEGGNAMATEMVMTETIGGPIRKPQVVPRRSGARR